MDWLWLFASAAFVALVWGLQQLGLVDLAGKRRPVGSSGMSSIGDEVFSPTRHEAAIELERQTVMPAPAPVAGDGDLGVYAGRILISVPTQR